MNSGGIVEGLMVPLTRLNPPETSSVVLASESEVAETQQAINVDEFDAGDLSVESAAVAAANDELLLASTTSESVDPSVVTSIDGSKGRTGRIVGQLQQAPDDAENNQSQNHVSQILAIRRSDGSLVKLVEVSAETNWQFEVDELEPGKYWIDPVAGDSEFDSVEIAVLADSELRVNLLLKLKPIEAVAVNSSAVAINKLDLTEFEVNSLYAAMGLLTAGGFALESAVSLQRTRQTYRLLLNRHAMIDLDHAMMLDLASDFVR